MVLFPFPYSFQRVSQLYAITVFRHQPVRLRGSHPIVGGIPHMSVRWAPTCQSVCSLALFDYYTAFGY
uniref:Uncharacterized protein n=1 Tax=Caenorhabditis japonica TaxID=281687 RepID=A0A8R1IWW3_CAEJA